LGARDELKEKLQAQDTEFQSSKLFSLFKRNGETLDLAGASKEQVADWVFGLNAILLRSGKVVNTSAGLDGADLDG